MKHSDVSNFDDTIDTRDIIGTIRRLDEDDEYRLITFPVLDDIHHPHLGVILIRKDYFPEYIKEFLIDTGVIPKDINPMIVIDWVKTAKNFSYDYMEIDFDGQPYVFR